MNMILGILIGFIAGLFFSRDRKDPVGDAASCAARLLQKVFDWISGVFKSRSGPPRNKFPENR